MVCKRAYRETFHTGTLSEEELLSLHAATALSKKDPFRGPNGKVRAENGICSPQHDFMLNNLSLRNKFVRFGLARAQMMLLGPQINYMPDKSHVIMINKLVP